jgi:hypothetical protein
MHKVCSDCGKSAKEVGRLKKISIGCRSKRFCKKCAHRRFVWLK